MMPQRSIFQRNQGLDESRSDSLWGFRRHRFSVRRVDHRLELLRLAVSGTRTKRTSFTDSIARRTFLFCSPAFPSRCRSLLGMAASDSRSWLCFLGRCVHLRRDGYARLPTCLFEEARNGIVVGHGPDTERESDAHRVRFFDTQHLAHHTCRAMGILPIWLARRCRLLRDIRRLTIRRLRSPLFHGADLHGEPLLSGLPDRQMPPPFRLSACAFG